MARQRGRSVRASQVEMIEIVMPADTNHFGNIWGGRVMALIDKAAALTAMRHCRTNVVTASVDFLVFRAAIKLGHIVRLFASINAAFSSSMEVGVKVLSEDPLSGQQVHCCSAYITMVSLDANGRPTEAPRLAPKGQEELRRQREALRRRGARLRARRRAQRADRRPGS